MILCIRSAPLIYPPTSLIIQLVQKWVGVGLQTRTYLESAQM